MPQNLDAIWADMEVAAQQFQNALENCQNTGRAVEGLKARLLKDYRSSSSQVFQARLAEWQADFQKVEGALARMTLELAETNKDYKRIDNEAQEVANAIKAQLGG